MKDSIRITFVGDIMCQREQSSAAYKRYGRYCYEKAFTPVRQLFQASDYVVGNLETPISDESLGFSRESYRFNTPESFLSALKWCGFHFLSTANNHCLDRGIVGLEHTARFLDRYEIAHSGTYLNKNESQKVFIKKICGVKIAILSFTYGTNSEFYGDPLPEQEVWRVDLLRKPPAKQPSQPRPVSLKSMLQDWLPMRIKVAVSALLGKIHRQIPEYEPDNVTPDEIGAACNEAYLINAREKILYAKDMADVVVVLPHIGGQYNPAPGNYTKWTMQWISNLGVDLVVANHPHVPLRCERFENGCIGAYSLGNFYFNPSDGCLIPNQFAEYGIVMHVDVSTTKRKVTEVSFQVVKSIVDIDGFATVHPVKVLLEAAPDARSRQKLIIENEAVVNRFCGGSGTITPLDEYPFQLLR
jgi:hypothetical protein